MALTIWKTNLKLIDVQEIEVPLDSQILHVDHQLGEMAIWYRCEPTAPKTKIKIAIVGTGNPAPNGEASRYIGTVMMGVFVWHVFQKLPD